MAAPTNSMRLLRAPLALTLSLALPSAALAQYPLAAAPELSDEEKIEKAKSLYVQAEGLAAEDVRQFGVDDLDDHLPRVEAG